MISDMAVKLKFFRAQVLPLPLPQDNTTYLAYLEKEEFHERLTLLLSKYLKKIPGYRL